LPSRLAELIAYDGIELMAAEVAELVLLVVLPATVNVVLTIGHEPLLVHDLKWMVWVPEAMPTFVASMS
jgi:hypothetical protein